jgi:hypothetical protein
MPKYRYCTACDCLIDGQSKEVRASAGTRKANLFASSMALVAKMVEQGQDPNAKLKKKWGRREMSAAEMSMWCIQFLVTEG